MKMGIVKTEAERIEEDNRKSGIFCYRCGEEIPKSEVEISKQSENSYLCSHCRKVAEKIEDE